jgi:hypothetical protein
MGLWNTHGMSRDQEDLREAISILGLDADELVVLADNAAREAWVWGEMAKQTKGQKKRKCNLISGMWRRRARKWKELAAAEEAKITESENFFGSKK